LWGFEKPSTILDKDAEEFRICLMDEVQW